MIVPILLFSTGVLLFCFVLLCLVTGLYYLASLVEEYSQVLSRVARFTALGVIIIHLLMLIFENYPTLLILLGIVTHLSYLILLRGFPYIRLNDPVFITSCSLALIQHCWWFYYFTQRMPPFNLIVSIFVICVWLLPFIFFISLSTNEPPLLPGFMQLTPNEQLMNLPDNVDSATRNRKSINRLRWVMEALSNVSKKYMPQFRNTNTNKFI